MTADDLVAALVERFRVPPITLKMIGKPNGIHVSVPGGSINVSRDRVKEIQTMADLNAYVKSLAVK